MSKENHFKKYNEKHLLAWCRRCQQEFKGLLFRTTLYTNVMSLKVDLRFYFMFSFPFVP